MIIRASNVYTVMEVVVAFANSTMFTTYAVYYVAALGLNPLELLIVGTVLELSVLLFEGITGVVADTYGRRRSVIIGMFVVAAGFMLQGALPWFGPAVPVFVMLLLAQIVWGVGHTFISGADMAWIVDEVGEKKVGSLLIRTKRVALVGTLLGIGASVLLSAAGPNLPYAAGGCLMLGLGVFLLVFMKETAFVRPAREPDASHWQRIGTTWLTGARAVRGQPLLLLILVVTLFSGAGSEGYDRLWEAHLMSEIGFPANISLSMAAWFGLISAATTLLGLLAIHIVERLLDMSSRRAVMAAMFALTAGRIAAILVFALSPNFTWAIVSALALGIIRTISAPIYDTWLNLNIESKSRATVLSMFSQSDALGQTGGGPFVGWIGSRWSIRASLVTAALLLTPILGVFARALRRGRR